MKDEEVGKLKAEATNIKLVNVNSIMKKRKNNIIINYY